MWVPLPGRKRCHEWNRMKSQQSHQLDEVWLDVPDTSTQAMVYGLVVCHERGTVGQVEIPPIGSDEQPRPEFGC
jgi:hypothetical protein